MPLNPPPTIELGLGLITQQLIRTDMGRAALVTFSVNVSGTPSPSVAQDAIDDFTDNFTTNILPMLDSEVQCPPPEIRLGDGSDTPFLAVNNGTTLTGGSSDTTVPPQVALLAKKTTPLGGKKNRGRTYWPFILPTNKVNETGVIDATFQSSVQTNFTAFLNQLVTDTTPMCISHKTFNVPLPPHYVVGIHTGPLVTQYQVENLVATQRRRVRS